MKSFYCTVHAEVKRVKTFLFQNYNNVCFQCLLFDINRPIKFKVMHSKHSVLSLNTHSHVYKNTYRLHKIIVTLCVYRYIILSLYCYDCDYYFRPILSVDKLKKKKIQNQTFLISLLRNGFA